MNDTPSDLAATLRRLSFAPAVLPASRLPRVLGVPEDEAAAIRAGLEAAGLLERWDDSPEGPAVVLSSAAAARLGLEMVGPAGANPMTRTGLRQLRWVRVGSKGERATSTTLTDLGEDLDGAEATADRLADPEAREPLEAVVAAEDLERDRAGGEGQGRRAWVSGDVHIRMVLGLAVPWPARARGGVCPGCGGRPLPAYACCVIDGCDRSGVDRLLPPVAPSERPRAYVPDAGGLEGGRGRRKVTKGCRKRRAG